MLTTASTIFHTPSGDIEVPSPPAGNLATFESNFAPRWLVFPNYIINTNRIESIKTGSNNDIVIAMESGNYYSIPVSKAQETFKALQDAFANGVTKKG